MIEYNYKQTQAILRRTIRQKEHNGSTTPIGEIQGNMEGEISEWSHQWWTPGWILCSTNMSDEGGRGKVAVWLAQRHWRSNWLVPESGSNATQSWRKTPKKKKYPTILSAALSVSVIFWYGGVCRATIPAKERMQKRNWYLFQCVVGCLTPGSRLPAVEM